MTDVQFSDDQFSRPTAASATRRTITERFMRLMGIRSRSTAMYGLFVLALVLFALSFFVFRWAFSI